MPCNGATMQRTNTYSDNARQKRLALSGRAIGKRAGNLQLNLFVHSWIGRHPPCERQTH